MKTVKPLVLYVMAIIIIICFVFWIATVFVGYMGDEWGSPPVDERSVPAPQTY
jgi:hypothetical protein